MENKFKFSHSRIRTFAEELFSAAKIFYNERLNNSPAFEEDGEKIAEVADIISITLNYVEKTGGLSVRAAEKDVLGNCISALYPLTGEILILGEEYHRIITPESYWLPVIIAHEIGHWVLHAPVFRRFRRQLDLFEECRLASTYAEIGNMGGKDISILDQQANFFARELLLPEAKIITALHQLGYFPPLIYKEHHLTLMSFEEYTRRLAEKVHQLLPAPLQLLSFRLLELGILQNKVHSGQFRYSA
ncbi:MAG TPA: ImmA/IrrE family metallo-endopeptidase [Bacteroidetes bacterium]|nr:ImmA/IrrE family metallo-endopeptidase [Bacteroidota bacterium]